MDPTENYIEQEVRIRLLEKIISTNKDSFEKLDAKIDSNFHWTIGMLFTILLAIIALFGGIIFTQMSS